MKKILLFSTILLSLLIQQTGFCREMGALFTVSSSGLTLTITPTRVNHLYPQAGIKIDTSGYALASPGTDCSFMHNGYCIFSVSSAAPKKIKLTGQSGILNIILCLEGVAHLSCQKYPVIISTKNYIIGGSISGLTSSGLIVQNNGGDNLHVAANATSFQFATPIATGGSYNVTLYQQPTGLICTITNGSGTNVNNNITNILITCQQRFAYVSDITSQLWQCPFNTNTGGFNGSCTALTIAPNISYDVAFHTFRGTTYAYLSVTNDTVLQCPINPITGGFSGPCTALTNVPAFQNTLGVTFNTFGTKTYAYVCDGTQTVWQCPMNAATGGFSGVCSPLVIPLATFTDSLTFKTFGNTTYAYVSAEDDKVWKCPVNTTTGGFSGPCIGLENTPSFNAQVYETVFNTFGNSTYAYVADRSDKVWRCPMNTSTGNFSGPCTALTNSTPPGFLLTNNLTFNTFEGNTYAYVTADLSEVWQCPINTQTGGFSSCTALTNVPPFFRTFSVKGIVE